MRRALTAALLACSSLPACSSGVEAVAVQSESIVGGARAPAGAWPGVVWLDSGCSGVLLHESTVVFAGHCGSPAYAWFGAELSVDVGEVIATSAGKQGGRRVALDGCSLHPRSEPGGGSDIGFCHLTEHVVERSALPPPLLGCERERLQPGSPVTLVGFGFDPERQSYGVKRTVVAEVKQLLSEIVIGDDSRGACDGDSGSPALLNLRTEPDAPADWRVVGVLSSGTAGSHCGAGRYTDLSLGLGWLEPASQRDLTPCFADDGSWVPTSGCRRPALDENGEPSAASASWLDHCGPGFDPTLTPRGGCAVALPWAGRPSFHWLSALLALAALRGARFKIKRLSS